MRASNVAAVHRKRAPWVWREVRHNRDSAISKCVEYEIGQRVVVAGGYDMDPVWLAGGHGYVGTIVDIAGNRAVVELDDEIELHASREPWKDFGDETVPEPIERSIVRGRWLALMLGYVGRRWEDPIERVHVGLCARRPDLADALRGGQAGTGIGAWVESHATMRHAPTTNR